MYYMCMATLAYSAAVTHNKCCYDEMVSRSHLMFIVSIVGL